MDRLKLELKRVTKRKADLEREIAELEFDRDKQYIESKGFSFDKIYTVNHEWVNWCNENNITTNILFTNFDYRIESLADRLGVRLHTIDELGDYSIYVPFEFLIVVTDVTIEVNENE